ncbi:hypothetical protein BGZ80_011237 [Entomortierella chlamydospora]|uniref:Uncharacterized protein n=1 Tax=Entomortierella chlamydospora TaxID=101097 RepID=A0A9P6N2R5_9FUNG|nr:hypothetical protein BGZ80_011237 [Entomortierella chlamydospora]
MRSVATTIITLIMSALTTADTTFQVFITDPSSSTVWIAGRPAIVKWILSISPPNATLTGSLPVELVGGKSLTDLDLIAVLGSGSFDANSLIVEVPDDANRGPDYVYSVRFGEGSYSELFTIKGPIIIGDPKPKITATKTPTTYTFLTTTQTNKTTKTASTINIQTSTTKTKSSSSTLSDTTIRTFLPTITMQFPAPPTTPMFPTFTSLDISPSLTSAVPLIDGPSTDSIPMSNNKNVVMRFSTFSIAAIATLASTVLAQVSPSHPRQGDIWILGRQVTMYWSPRPTTDLPIQLLTGETLTAQKVVADLGTAKADTLSLTIDVPDEPVGWYTVRIGTSYSHVFAIQKDSTTPPTTPEPTEASNATTTANASATVTGVPTANATGATTTIALPTYSSSSASAKSTTAASTSAASYLKVANVMPLVAVAAATFLSSMAL